MVTGYQYGGAVSVVDYSTPVAPVPASVQGVEIKRVHHSMPAPTLVDGRPVDWQGTVEFGTWGRVRVLVDGVDVTYFRDRPVVIGDTQLTDPYWWNNASLTFPQITNVEAWPSWLRETAVVRIDRVVDGAVVDPDNPPFFGIVDAIEPGEVCQVSCSGWYTGQASTVMHQPSVQRRGAEDARRVLWRANGIMQRAVRFYGSDTGINLQRAGSRDMTVLGFTDDVLGLCVTRSGDSLTLLPDPSIGRKSMRLQWRTLKSTPDFTVHNGAHGVKVNPRSDRLDNLTAVYGEGVAPSGERWRNGKFPNLPPHYTPPFPGPLSEGMTDADTSTGDGISVLARALWGNGDLADHEDRLLTEFTDEIREAVEDVQRSMKLPVTGTVDLATWNAIFAEGFEQYSFRQAYFEPLSVLSATQKHLYAPDGTVVGLNPDYDRSVVRNEVFVGYGDRISKREARRNATAMRTRSGSVNGTMVLTSDPAEMSRLDIRPGMTGSIKHLMGTGTAGMKVYVSSVQVGWSNPQLPVTVAWSTTPRHYIDLATIKARKMEARRDPVAHWRHQLARKSTLTSDAINGWEGESGAGVVRTLPITGGTWNVFPMVAAELGTIGQFRLETNPAREFYVCLFGKEVKPGRLNAVLGNPNVWANADDEVTTFTQHEDSLRDLLMIEAWGTPAEPCGYPRSHTKPDGTVSSAPLTGVWRDNGSFEFATYSGFLWLAVYPVGGDTKIKGRARVVMDEGA